MLTKLNPIRNSIFRTCVQSQAPMRFMMNQMDPNIKVDKDDHDKHWEMTDRMGIEFTVDDRPGILNKALGIFTNTDIDLTHIQSKPLKKIDSKDSKKMKFLIDFIGTPDLPHIKRALK